MEEADLKRTIEQKIEQARQDRAANLDLSFSGMTSLPESIATISTAIEYHQRW